MDQLTQIVLNSLSKKERSHYLKEARNANRREGTKV